MITLNDTPTKDNDVKWVVKILGDNNTYYMTDSDKGLVLTNSYIGDGLLRTGDFETLSQITDAVDISGGGNIDQVSSFTFGIIRWSTDIKLDGFMNEFYPATSGEYLVGREVNIGIIWNGTADTNITWFKKFYIEDYDYTPAYINLYCVEKSELDWMELPYYKVQKINDNKISYFPNAPEENFGLPIPIVYGDFSLDIEANIYEQQVMPGILVDSTKLQCIFASHYCYSDSYANEELDGLTISVPTLLNFISSARTYLLLFSEGSALSNTEAGYLISLQNTVAEVYGKMQIPLRGVGKDNNENISNLFNNIESDYSILNNGKIALKTPVFNEDIGTLSDNAEDVGIYFRVSSSNGVNRSASISFSNYNDGTFPSGNQGGISSYTDIGGNNYATSVLKSHTFGNLDTGMPNPTHLPWTITDLTGLDYYILNNTTDDIYVYSAYLRLNKIRVAGMQAKLFGKYYPVHIRYYNGHRETIFNGKII